MAGSGESWGLLQEEVRVVKEWWARVAKERVETERMDVRRRIRKERLGIEKESQP